LTSHALALVALTALLSAWVAVQLAWRRAFPSATGDPDALAGRLGCHGCRCEEPCERRASTAPVEAEETDP
jgi:hypothetical protein